MDDSGPNPMSPQTRPDSASRLKADCFESGDRVQLASGGATMTVSTRTIGRSERYVCQWFVGDAMEHGVFPVDALALVNAASPATSRRIS